MTTELADLQAKSGKYADSVADAAGLLLKTVHGLRALRIEVGLLVELRDTTLELTQSYSENHRTGVVLLSLAKFHKFLSVLNRCGGDMP